MSSASPSLFPLLAFAVALISLTQLSRQISLRTQGVIFYLTHSQDMAVVGLFIVLMPGIYIHESAHWLMARLLGLRTGKFRVWPQRKGNMIGMGQVSVEQKDLWRDSLVGLAPLLFGSVVVTLIGHYVFRSHTITAALGAGDLAGALGAFRASFGAVDGALWAYLLFAVANAMMPSASDREPIKPVLLYMLVAALLYVVLGMPLTPFTAAFDWLRPVLEDYVSALVFVILLDLLVLFVLWGIMLLFERRYR